MLFIRKPLSGSDKQIAERIKEDLLQIFGKKGIIVTKIQIDMKPDNLNVRVCINE